MNTTLSLSMMLAVGLCVPFRAAAEGGTQPGTQEGGQVGTPLETQAGTPVGTQSGDQVQPADPGVDTTTPKPIPKTETQLRELADEQLWKDFVRDNGPLMRKAATKDGLSEEEWLDLNAAANAFMRTAETEMYRQSVRTVTEKFKPVSVREKEKQQADPLETAAATANETAKNKAGDFIQNMRKLTSRIDIERDPGNPLGYSHLGEDLVKEENYREGAAVLEKAVQLKSNDSKTYSAYGTAAFHLGDFALARNAAERALRLDPKNDAAFAVLRLSEGKQASVSLPSVLTGQGGGDGAFAMPSQGPAVSAGPGGPGASGPAPEGQASAVSRPQARMRPEAGQKSAAFAKEAAAALSVKDYLKAIEAATRAIELNDNNAQAWNYRAMAQSKLGRYEAAAKDASYALSLAPNNAAALHTRSWALNKLSRFKEGLADADLVLSREPDNAFAYQNKAFALAGIGDRKGMLEALKRSAEIEPRFKARYEAALQVPENSDVLFLFDQDPGPKVAPPEDAPVQGGGRRGLAFAVTAVGGFLAALAVVVAVFPGLRKGMSVAARGAAASQENGAVLQGQGEAGSFWKKYRRVREVAVGGMGVVYEAEDTSLGRRVAVKKMRDEIRLDRRERERFLQEARTVASLKHPNIVEIYSIVEDGGEVYLVFEFAEGKTLHEVLSGGLPLPFDAARRVLKDSCEAVECAHRNKIVHRDIKPSNIMVAAGGGAKVMDFGVARQAKEAATKAATNTVVGTPPYMAPESEQGTVGPQSDVYGLGVVFYEMLSGKLPFAGSGAGMLLNKMNAKFTPLSQAAAGLPPAIDDVISRVLSPDPAKRYRTVGEFRAAVEELKAA
ncbi:MAG: protein kinase [Elusimicrobia bacterium]|nr:protein kinase [Elusimicrobiota bacterium]